MAFTTFLSFSLSHFLSFIAKGCGAKHGPGPGTAPTSIIMHATACGRDKKRGRHAERAIRGRDVWVCDAAAEAAGRGAGRRTSRAGRNGLSLSPGLDNSTGNSTATRQDSSTAILDSYSTDLDRPRQTSTDPPLTACARASRCQARQSSTELDRARQSSTELDKAEPIRSTSLIECPRHLSAKRCGWHGDISRAGAL